MQAIILKIALFFGGIILYGSIYTIHIITINGQDKLMQDFQGKKILIVVIPVTKTANDSAFLRTIDTVSRNYAQQISVIGVPSIEDGYTSNQLNQLQTYYHSFFGNRVTVTRGMYTRKESGTSQHELFSWLTRKEKNIHFDYDVSGVGQKFFVSEQGELYGVSDPEGRLNSRLMDRMIQLH
jgi:glutathione peroxidase